jgi:hypothetical protein
MQEHTADRLHFISLIVLFISWYMIGLFWVICTGNTIPVCLNPDYPKLTTISSGLMDIDWCISNKSHTIQPDAGTPPTYEPVSCNSENELKWCFVINSLCIVIHIIITCMYCQCYNSEKLPNVIVKSSDDTQNPRPVIWHGEKLNSIKLDKYSESTISS